jgi:hypothetical protein
MDVNKTFGRSYPEIIELCWEWELVSLSHANTQCLLREHDGRIEVSLQHDGTGSYLKHVYHVISVRI